MEARRVCFRKRQPAPTAARAPKKIGIAWMDFPYVPEALIRQEL